MDSSKTENQTYSAFEDALTEMQEEMRKLMHHPPISTPTPFTGDLAQDPERFLREVRAFFDAKPSVSHETLTRELKPFLEGSAEVWLARMGGFISVEDFETCFRITFGSSVRRIELSDAVFQVRQTAHESPVWFVARQRRLCLRLEAKWPDEDMIAFLIGQLHNRYRISLRANRPTSVAELIDRCAMLERAINDGASTSGVGQVPAIRLPLRVPVGPKYQPSERRVQAHRQELAACRNKLRRAVYQARQEVDESPVTFVDCQRRLCYELDADWPEEDLVALLVDQLSKDYQLLFERQPVTTMDDLQDSLERIEEGGRAHKRLEMLRKAQGYRRS